MLYGDKPGDMELELLERRWVLRDYGTEQYLWDFLTNECIQVFGKNSKVDGGPWELVCSDGKAALDCKDDDGNQIFVFPSNLSRFRLCTNSTGDTVIYGKDESASDSRLYDEWIKEQRWIHENKTLLLEVPGYTPFKCEFVWGNTQLICGEKPVGLWVNFSWVLDFVLGKAAVDKAFRYASYVKRMLESHGLSAVHFHDSTRSQLSRSSRKRKQSAADELSAPDSEATEWNASITAILLFLEEVMHNKKIGGKKGMYEDADERAKALLRVFLKWPIRKLDALAFALPRTGMEMLLRDLVVDIEALKESEETHGDAKHLRTSGCVFIRILQYASI